MSLLLEILRCILCCEEGVDDFDNNDSESWVRNISSSNRNPYDYRVVPYCYDTFPRASAPSVKSQSSAQTQSYSNSSQLPQTSINPSSVQTREKSNQNNYIPTKLPETASKPDSSLPSPSSSKLLPSLSKLPLSASKPLPSLSGPHLSLPKLASSSSSSSSSKPPSSAAKPTLSLAPSNPTNQQTTTNYIRVQKGTSLIYAIPEDIKDLIKKDIVPGVLKEPLSTSTYKDYFAALLYAEDFYIEKWSNFKLVNVALKLHDAAIYNRSCKYKNWNQSDEKDDKIFVAFEIDSVQERRPFLLSRDFVFVRPSGSKAESFQAKDGEDWQLIPCFERKH